ncbi:MAG: hypothetical protein HW410_1339 [Nitrosarchaeum sp.]|nr:hypothetical protein [Nitrosarchaeum sp.]
MNILFYDNNFCGWNDHPFEYIVENDGIVLGGLQYTFHIFCRFDLNDQSPQQRLSFCFAANPKPKSKK